MLGVKCCVQFGFEFLWLLSLHLGIVWWMQNDDLSETEKIYHFSEANRQEANSIHK